MDAFRVISPGSFTTVQDRGRYSFIDRGVPPSGALDLFAYRHRQPPGGQSGRRCRS